MADLAVQKKKLLEDTRKLKREQDAWQAGSAARHREELQLKESIRSLQGKKDKADKQLAKVTAELSETEAKLASVTEETATATQKLEELDGKVADKATELADLHAEIGKRKATVDSELEQYETEKKTAIKDSIMAEHAKLQPVVTELKDTKEQLQVAKDELAAVNQAFTEEERQHREQKAIYDDDIQAAKDELQTVNAELDIAKESLQTAVYNRDQVLIDTQKVREEHAKFIAYEKKSRKILEAKDLELQEREAEISTQQQFLQNTRSFLPKL